MDIKELNQQLGKKKLSPVYIFTGPEVAVMDIYLKQISKVMKQPILRVESLGAIFSKLQNKSIMNKPNLYLISNDKEYLNHETLWDGINLGATQGDNVLIFTYPELDKRGKFYKRNLQTLTEFDKLSTDTLAKYIYQNIKLNMKNGSKLAEICDNNYSRILLESNKLEILADVRGINIDEAFFLALKEKLIYIEPKDDVFAIIDHICKRDVTATYHLINSMPTQSPLGIISLLYSNFKAMLLVRGAGNAPDITGRTGLTAWQVKLAKEKGNHYSTQELLGAVKRIRETEKGIKTGKIEVEMALDYILVGVL